jgi:hypothetical protein
MENDEHLYSFTPLLMRAESILINIILLHLLTKRELNFSIQKIKLFSLQNKKEVNFTLIE